MDELKSSVGEEGLVLEGMLPLAWRAVEPAAAQEEMPVTQAAAEEILRYIYSIEEHAAEGVDEHAAKPQELARIELKLNFLLSLLSQVFTQYFPLPPPTQVRLSARDVEWIGVEAPPAGQDVIISLYLSTKCPRPVSLPGRVISIVEEPAGRRITVQFAGLVEVVQGWLEKIIFRHHRRTVALSRRAAAPKGE